SASRACSTTWSSTSPSSPWSSASGWPSSIVSATSYASSRRYSTREACVRAPIQGQCSRSWAILPSSSPSSQARSGTPAAVGPSSSSPISELPGAGLWSAKVGVGVVDVLHQRFLFLKGQEGGLGSVEGQLQQVVEVVVEGF